MRKPFDFFLNDLFVVTVVFYFSSVKSLLLPGEGVLPTVAFRERFWGFHPKGVFFFSGFRYMNG